MAISSRAVYFYNASKALTKQGSLTQTDSTHYVYDETPAEINQGDINVTQLVIALPLASFTGGYPMIMYRSPKGFISGMLAMSTANWYITEDTTETQYQVFYITLSQVGWTYSAGRYAIMCGYLTNGAYDNLNLAFYTVSDGVNNYEDLDADMYAEIFAAIYASFSDVAERLTAAETYLGYAFNYVAGQQGVDYVQYLVSPITSQASLPIGATRWNSDEECLETRIDADVVIQHGREMLRQARNNTGSTIADGKVVYVTGAIGQMPTIALADKSSYANADAIIGVTTQAIANNATGEVCIIGIVNGLNTSAFSDGDVVYLDSSGGITATKPTAPSAIVRIGQVLYSHATLGKLLVDKQLHPKIEDASDVKFGMLSTNDVMIYDVGGYWKNISKTAFQANCVQTDADNVMTGANTFTQQLITEGGIDNSNEKIVNLADGTVATDAATKGQTETYTTNAVSTHNSSVTAHTSIRTLIEALQLAIQRLDGRGVSYGEIPYETATLIAMDTATRNTTITAAIQALSWGSGYTPTSGDLVYDEGVGSGIDYHEWEYNGTNWVDNGAINQPEATNTIFGNVKGDGTYLSIVAGLVQVLLADYATAVGASGASYTYAQIYTALATRYTKDETDALLESLKLIQGVEETTLGAYTNGQAIASTTGYDKLHLVYRFYNGIAYEFSSLIITQAQFVSGIAIFLDTQTSVMGCTVEEDFAVACDASGTLYVYGIKYIDTETDNVVISTPATESPSGTGASQAAVNIEVTNKLSDIVDGTIVVAEATKATQDDAGNVIDETYKKISTFINIDLGTNRYDNDSKTVGYYLTAANVLTANASYSVTDYFEVNEGEIIVSSVNGSAVNMRFITAFDKNQVNLSALGRSAYVGSYTVPATVKFLRVTLDVGNASISTKIEHSATATPTALTLFEPKTELIKTSFLPITRKETDIIFDSNFEDANFEIGGWTLTSGVLSSPAADFNDVAYYSGAYVTVDSDLIVCKIKLTTANSKIAISRNCAIATNASRVDYVDFTNGKIGWYNYQVQNTLTDDESSYTVLEEYTMTGFTATLNREYMIESIRKDGYLAQIKLTDLSTFDTWSTDLKLANDVSGWGYRGISVISGSINLIAFRIMSYQPYTPKLMIIGHSFVEGNSIGFPNKDDRYSALCRDALSGDCFIGGQGGATSQYLIDRYSEYLYKIKPKYVLVDIGVNDRVPYSTQGFIARLQKIIELIETYEGIPILVTVCPQSGIATTFLEYANAWIKQSGYRYVDFAYITTTNNDGVTYDSSKFLVDGTHPTIATHLLMFNKIKYDVPEIFY